MALLYPLGLADTDFSDGESNSGYQPQNFVYGADITIPSSGTVTQLGVKCVSATGTAVNLKIGLYTSGGTLLAQSTTITGVSGAGLQWANSGAISVSVSAGKHYVLVSAATEDAKYGYDTAGNGSFATEAYASAMASSEAITDGGDTAQLYGVRLDFTAGGSAFTPRALLLGVG